MIFHKGYLAFTTLIFSFYFLSCKSTKNVAKPKTETQKLVDNFPTEEKATPLLDRKSPSILSKKMLANEFNYKWLNSKFSANTNIDGKTNSFNATVRSRKDSALWMSMSLFGIEGGKAFGYLRFGKIY